MSAPRVHFVVGPTYAYARGHQARQLLTDAGSRPVWGGLRRAWATVPSKAADAIALAECRGWLVTVEHEGPAPITSLPNQPITSMPDDGQDALW